MSHEDDIQDLIDADACSPAVEFTKKMSSILEAWQECPRSDWMMWLVRDRRLDFPSQLREFANWCIRDSIAMVYDNLLLACLEASENPSFTQKDLDTAHANAIDVPCKGMEQEGIKHACLSLCQEDIIQGSSDVSAAVAGCQGDPTLCSKKLLQHADKLRELIPDPGV